WVVAPKAPVDIAGVPAAGWWRIDPASGTTLGFLADGTGGDMAEEAELDKDAAEKAQIARLKALKVWIRAGTIATCGVKLIGDIQQKGSTNWVAAALCVVAAFSSLCSDAMSWMDIWKAEREVLSVLGLLFGLGSTWAGIMIPT